jgi:hypothetical protein
VEKPKMPGVGGGVWLVTKRLLVTARVAVTAATPARTIHGLEIIGLLRQRPD